MVETLLSMKQSRRRNHELSRYLMDNFRCKICKTFVNMTRLFSSNFRLINIMHGTCLGKKAEAKIKNIFHAKLHYTTIVFV